MSDSSADAINRHYGRKDTFENIIEALKSSGANPDALTRDDLASFEEFHIGGREATRSMARLANLMKGSRVLDVGCGIGGPARTIAAEFGCRVTGLDLTEEFCRTARLLTEKVGLKDSIDFVQGSALEMPFGNAEFDVVWTQHASMNVEDKESLYCEIHRVLKPGGTLALYDIMAGSKQELHYPVLWASDSTMNFLREPDEIRAILRQSGFTVIDWLDMTDQALSFWQKRLNAIKAGKQDNGTDIRLVVGEQFAERAANSFRNLREGRIVVAQSVLRRT